MAAQTDLTLTPVLPKGTPVTFGMIGAASFEPVNGGSSGGWQIVDRPRQKAITQWMDASPQSMVLTLILDGGPNQNSIEADALRVYNWQYPTAGALQPPVLEITGPVDNPAKALYWVVNVVKFDEDEVLRDAAGDRTQQHLTMTLWEYVPAYASVLTSLSPAQAAQLALTSSGSSAARRNYVVKAGDTLAKIAPRVLGNQALATELATLNGIRDPRNLTAGQRIVLPT